MPDNKINERLMRIRAIDELFSSNPGKTFSAEDIVEHLGSRNKFSDYNRHKLSRDLKEIASHENIRLKEEYVVSASGAGRPVRKIGYADKDVSIFSDSLDTDDIYLIRDILEMFNLKGLNSLNSFRKFEVNYGKKLPKRRHPIISFTKNPLEQLVASNLDKLLSHIRGHEAVTLIMRDRRTASSEKRHIVSPWYLREYNRRWYLFGQEDGEIKHYALDRLKSVRKCVKTIYVVPDRSIDEILENVVGVSLGEKDDPIMDVYLWVSNESADFVLKKPIHKSQVAVDKNAVESIVGSAIIDKLPGKEGVFLKIRCIINYELKREMMSFGEELIVLWPSDLRDFVKRKLYKMYCKYE